MTTVRLSARESVISIINDGSEIKRVGITAEIADNSHYANADLNRIIIARGDLVVGVVRRLLQPGHLDGFPSLRFPWNLAYVRELRVIALSVHIPANSNSRTTLSYDKNVCDGQSGSK